MDMSYFRRQRAAEPDQSLKLLLAKIAARQSATPTALLLAQPGQSETATDLAPETHRFIAPSPVRREKAPVCGSFHGAVASRLLTPPKPS